MAANKETRVRQAKHWPLSYVCPPAAALETAPGMARAHVRDVLAQWRMQEIVETAELVVSELVTNVVHQSTDDEGHLVYVDGGAIPVFRLGLFADRVTLLIQVWDALPGTPRKQQTVDDDESGRGLAIVEALSADWGTREIGGGKIVFARLDCARVQAVDDV